MPFERVAEVLDRSAARHTGLVVGVQAGGERGFWSRGVQAGAVFEIGSITKTFTATVLAALVRDGVVALDDPVARHLPVAPPVKRREIALEDLATHHSGLPGLPAGMLRKALTSERRDPYAHLDDARMREAILATKPKRPPGAKFAYSNYGFGLLGYALAQSAGVAYGDLVRGRITGPLGLDQTGLDTGPLTQGHNSLGRPAGPWNLAQLAGAGGLRSTANDLLSYLSLHAPEATGPLAAAAADTRVRRRRIGKVGIGLGWLILPDGALAHEGGTGGFRSYVAVEPDSGHAVVVLASQARSAGRLGEKVRRALA